MSVAGAGGRLNLATGLEAGRARAGTGRAGAGKTEKQPKTTKYQQIMIFWGDKMGAMLAIADSLFNMVATQDQSNRFD